MKPGLFMVLPPTTSYAGDHVELHGSELGGLVVASYHTHPCLPDHYVQFFSPPDLNEPLYFRRPVFMGDFCTGNVHEFKPGDKPDAEEVDSGGGNTLYLPKGRILGKFTTAHAVIS
jgi:hypothetical protein